MSSLPCSFHETFHKPRREKQLPLPTLGRRFKVLKSADHSLLLCGGEHRDWSTRSRDLLSSAEESRERCS